MSQPKFLTLPGFEHLCLFPHGSLWDCEKASFIEPTRMASGHLEFRISRGKFKLRKYVHRLVLETFVGPCPKGMEGCHNNGAPADNRIINLRWDTHTNNQRDMIKHNTSPVGEKNGQAKLSNKDVKDIRQLLALGDLNQYKIAEQFGIDQSTVSNINTGKRRKVV